MINSHTQFCPDSLVILKDRKLFEVTGPLSLQITCVTVTKPFISRTRNPRPNLMLDTVDWKERGKGEG